MTPEVSGPCCSAGKTAAARACSTPRHIRSGRWRDLVEPHHATIRRLLARYRGNEVDTAGDGFFATFDGPARGVRCAHAIVGAVNSLGLEVRAGVHTGEVETINNKVGGVAVNISALRQSQGQARFSCHRRSRTSRQGPGSRSRIRASMS